MSVIVNILFLSFLFFIYFFFSLRCPPGFIMFVVLFCFCHLKHNKKNIGFTGEMIGNAN